MEELLLQLLTKDKILQETFQILHRQSLTRFLLLLLSNYKILRDMFQILQRELLKKYKMYIFWTHISFAL